MPVKEETVAVVEKGLCNICNSDAIVVDNITYSTDKIIFVSQIDFYAHEICFAMAIEEAQLKYRK